MPSEIYKTKDLTSEEKLIAERITALCKKEGYAWISNKALADMYGIRADTVSKHIRHLIKYGYLKCLYGKNDNGHKKRTIYLANSIWDNQAIVNSLNNQSNIGYTSKYNNKYTYKDNNINYSFNKLTPDHELNDIYDKIEMIQKQYESKKDYETYMFIKSIMNAILDLM